MRGQINGTAYLHGGGKSLQVTGWVDFDTDETGATVTVTVTQDGGASGTDDSGYTPKVKKAWAAEVQTEGNAKFVPGPALAEVTAKVDTQTGQEDYPGGNDPPWARYITLTG
jgi:hypothetical protein